MPHPECKRISIEVAYVDAMRGRSVADWGRLISNSEGIAIVGGGAEDLLESVLQLWRHCNEERGISVLREVLGDVRNLHHDPCLPLAFNAIRGWKTQNYRGNHHGYKGANELPFVHASTALARIGLGKPICKAGAGWKGGGL